MRTEVHVSLCGHVVEFDIEYCDVLTDYICTHREDKGTK